MAKKKYIVSYKREDGVIVSKELSSKKIAEQVKARWTHLFEKEGKVKLTSK